MKENVRTKFIQKESPKHATSDVKQIDDKEKKRNYLKNSEIKININTEYYDDNIIRNNKTVRTTSTRVR